MTARALLPSLLLAACSDLPAEPTYFADVQPILRANCARCHGADPWDPKIAKYRLDRYVKGDDPLLGADVWEYAQPGETGEAAPIIRVAVDHEAPAMPPDSSLSDRQRDLLARWVDQGASKGTRDNRVPEIVLVSSDDVTAADQTFTATVRVWDDDLDGIIGQLWAHDLATSDAEDLPIGTTFGGGMRELTIDTGQLASTHTFELYAILDDGFHDILDPVNDPTPNRTRASLVGALYLDHGARGTAPTVRVVAPNGGETLIGSADITWTATDPDVGDALAIDLALMVDGTDTVAATIASKVPNTQTFSWTIPSSLSDQTPYRIRVTATDLVGNVRSDLSDGVVTVSHPTTTTYTWADIQPIMITYCVDCHGQPAKTVAIESFRFDKYNAQDDSVPMPNSDLGVFEMRSQIYTRLITQQNMPPASTSNKPTAAERDLVGNWILGGAPFGSGPADPRPTFTWMAPSATQASGTTVTLTWSAADAGGLTAGRIEYAKINGLAATGCTAMNTASATWATVTDPLASATLAGAPTWMETITWPLPAALSGYYCFRGVVTDTANQTVTTLNPYGIKR